MVGSKVTLFKPGDWVYYAGSIDRPGRYAEYGLVDERIAGHKPTALTAVRQQLAALGIQYVDYVASLTHSDDYSQQVLDILIPQGKLALIDNPKTFDIMPMKRKAFSLHWEFMFTRTVF
ncbi:MAG: hypothetical protein ACL7AX_06740 [Candidatus Arsenophonus phytopathogenicus]